MSPEPTHLRQTLVPLDVAMHVLSRTRPCVRSMVERGDLRWVFDVSAPSGRMTRQEWRFWIRDLYAPCILRHLDTDDAVDEVVGHKTERWLCLRTVGEMLWVARPHLDRLECTGELGVHVIRGIKCVARPALCAFLECRLVH